MNIIEIKDKLSALDENVKITLNNDTISLIYSDLMYPIKIKINNKNKVVFSYQIRIQIVFFIVMLSHMDRFIDGPVWIQWGILFFAIVIPIGIIISEIRVRYLRLIISDKL